jgi:zinc transport system substrate-binding protein
MKKILLVIVTILSLSACAPKPSDGKLRVVVSFYVLEDLTRKIGGEWVDIIDVMPSGSEPHEFEPSTQTMRTLSDATLIFILGNDFEPWFSDAYDNVKKEGQQVIVLSDGIPTLINESTGQIDPHLWTSIRNIITILDKIKTVLIQADPTHQSSYEANYESAKADFEALDVQYQTVVNDRIRDEFITNHAAFGYLAKDYGLTMIPIMGLEPDAEPDASTMAKIIDLVKQYKIPYILYEDEANADVAKTIAQETGAKVGILRPGESLNTAQIQAGDDLLSIMRQNLVWLKKALQE